MKAQALLLITPFIVGDDFFIIIPAKCPVCEPEHPAMCIVNMQTGSSMEFANEQQALDVMYFMMALSDFAEFEFIPVYEPEETCNAIAGA